MQKTIITVLLTLCTLLPNTVLAYDAEFAAKANQLLSKMDQQALSASACKIAPDKLLEMMRKDEHVTLLDVRTPAEMDVVGLTWKQSLAIPLDQLFTPANLDRLPKEGKLVVICHSGNRAAAAAVMLRAAGVDNALFLNGGLIALTQTTTPVTAP